MALQKNPHSKVTKKKVAKKLAVKKSLLTDSVHMVCTTGGSNKFYNLEIQKNGAKYELLAAWGRIGTKGQTISKGIFTHHVASMEMAAIEKSKKAKGYKTLKTKTDATLTTQPLKMKKVKKVDPKLERFSSLLE